MPLVLLLLSMLQKHLVHGIVWILLHLGWWGTYLVVSIIGRNVPLIGFVYLLLISRMHLSGLLVSCRMHNIKVLRLEVFLGNLVVGGDPLLFAQSHWIVQLPMLIVPWVWWDQRILYIRGCCWLFYVRCLFLWSCGLGVICVDWLFCPWAVFLWCWVVPAPDGIFISILMC